LILKMSATHNLSFLPRILFSLSLTISPVFSLLSSEL
jgi:hypothetical protein